MWNLPLLPSQTDAQTNLSVSGAVVYNQRDIIHGMFRASVVRVSAHRCRYIFVVSVSPCPPFNSALDVPWILKARSFRSKGKYSPDGKSFLFFWRFCVAADGGSDANLGPVLLRKCCWGKGGADEENVFDYPAWMVFQTGSGVRARHESAQLVRGHE